MEQESSLLPKSPTRVSWIDGLAGTAAKWALYYWTRAAV